MEEKALRGRIITKFGTVLKFAEAIGWSNRKAYDIVNGRQEPSGSDIDEMCSTLGVTIPDEMRTLFFNHLSTTH